MGTEPLVGRLRVWQQHTGMLVLATVCTLGCGGDRSAPEVPPEKQWCSALCNLNRRCTADSTPCEAECLDRNLSYFARTAPGELILEAECLLDKRCTDDIQTMIDDCCHAALDAIEPTPESYAFCKKMEEVFFRCNWFGAPDDCAQAFAHLRENGLNAAIACQSSDCTSLNDCLLAEFTGEDE